MTAREPGYIGGPDDPPWIPMRIGEMLSGHPTAIRPVHAMFGLALMLLYGGAMGSYGLWFSGNNPDQWLQVLYSAIKVPLLLGATFALSLPSFFVFNTIAGLGRDFREVVGTLVATQTALSVILGSLAPLTLLWYASNADYLSAVLFNGAMFAAASLGVLPLVRRNYRALIAKDPKHRKMVILWGLVYTFIGVQMGWTLRPFIGDPNNIPEFFRSNGWGNAYIVVMEILVNALDFSLAY